MKKLEQEILKLIESVQSLEDIKPILEKTITEVEPYIERSRHYIVDMKGKSIKQLMNNYEFTFAEASSAIQGMSADVASEVLKTMSNK